MSRLAIGGVSSGTDVTAWAGAGFLSYEDPDNYKFFWAKQFKDSVTPTQAVGIIDCAVRVPVD